MSKAFVREDSDDGDDDAPDPALQLPPGSGNYMTPGCFARLTGELEHLLKRERPKMVEVVTWAASNGDRSENGDYLYGKKRLREIDRRIRYLNKRTATAVVVDPRQQTDTGRVYFGATVTIGDEAGAEQTYSIVGVDEADAGRGLISWTAPLARALLKAQEGDQVRFQSPAGWRQIEVLEIQYKTIESQGE